MPDPLLPRRRTTLLGGLAVAAGTFVAMVATESRLAIVWDEGYTLGREARVRAWLHALRDPAGFATSWTPPSQELVQSDRVAPPRPDQLDTRAELFNPGVLDWFWPFAREEPHGHPPFYALVGLTGDVLAPGLAPLPRARLGPMIAFGLTAGALFLFVARRWGAWPALGAAGAWVLQPQLFGHGHYATYDALLSCLWVGSILAFAGAVETSTRNPRWGWVVAFGVLAGWAADTKLTAWFLPLPFLVWAILYRDRRALWTLAVGGVVAIATLYAFCPPFWSDPIGGMVRFLHSNTSRARSINIEILFLGRVYVTPRESLPWYNTLLWTAFVTPVGFLVLALLGVVRALRLRRSEPFGLLAIGHWAFLLVLRALPHTPGHDGVRQFLPAFGCLAVVAGLGSAEAVERFGRWGKALVVAALAEGAISITLMMPVPLSYYSPLIGGLPGATALGMEPTYYWDALTDDALAWLNANTPPGHKVAFATNPTSWLYLCQTGKLRPDSHPLVRGPIAWYIVQNRPGAFRPLDRELVARLGPRHVLVEKLGVPLVWAFPFEEVERHGGERP